MLYLVWVVLVYVFQLLFFPHPYSAPKVIRITYSIPVFQSLELLFAYYVEYIFTINLHHFLNRVRGEK